MSRFTAFLLLFTLLVPIGAAAQSEQPPSAHASVTLPPELDRVLRDYEREWSARSPGGLARLFTNDGFVLQPGRQPARGHAAIIGAYQGSGGGPLALRALAYATADTVGYIVGAYATATGDPDIGKFILLLRRGRDGTWMIAADMDNGNARR